MCGPAGTRKSITFVMAWTIPSSFGHGVYLCISNHKRWGAFMNEIIHQNLIYAAGLIDGEGSILLTRGSRNDKFRHPCVSVSNTSKELIDFLKENFGGTVSKHKTYKAHHKPSWSWSVSYNAAVLFVEQIRPFLKEKSKCKRCDMILTSYKSLTNRNGKYTDAQVHAKLDFERTFLSS